MTTNQIIQLLSALFTGITIIYLARQVLQQRKAIEADTFLRIVEKGQQIGFSRKMDIIRNMPTSGTLTEEEGEASRYVMDFFNDMMHLIHAGYLPLEQVMRIYYVPIMYCNYKLRKTWLPAFREFHHDVPFYYRFEELCLIAECISPDSAKLWQTRDFVREWRMSEMNMLQPNCGKPFQSQEEWQQAFRQAYLDKGVTKKC